MGSKKSSFFSTNAGVFVIALSLVFIAFMAYKDTLGYSFIGGGTLPLIESGRIQSFNDLIRIFSEPFKSGFETKGWFYYRPVSTLSFGIDYAIWGLNPSGYHLTNLILHALASILVFLLIRFLTSGSNITAWFGALIFTIHPVIIETLPAPARRHNILEALFLLSSLLLWMKYFSSALHKKSYLFLSVIFYAAALGSKESGILLPVLIFTYLMILGQQNISFIRRILPALKKTLPFLAVTFIFFAWRTHIIGGMGGDEGKQLNLFTINTITKSLPETVKTYFLQLLYPADFLSSHINQDLIPHKILLSFFIFILIIIWKRNTIKDFFINSAEGRLVSFSLIWLFLPLVFCSYLSTLLLAHRCLYGSVISFSIILSVLLAHSFNSIMNKLKASHPPLFLLKGILIFMITAGLYTSILIYSPLFKTYGEWRAISNIAHSFFDKLSVILPELPENAVIRIHNFPSVIAPYRSQIPHANEVAGITDFSVKALLNLKRPANRMEVIFTGKDKIDFYPRNIDIDIKKDTGRNIDVIIMLD